MKVDFERFCRDFDVAVVVLSRDRAEVLKNNTDKLVRNYLLFYSGEGYDDEGYHCKEKFEVPRHLYGLSVVRNYVLDKLDNRIVIFCDDDISRFFWTSSKLSVKLDYDGVELMMMNMVVHSLDQGCTVFGPTDLDIRKTSPLVPFNLRTVFGTMVGVIGRELQFDERNLLKTDYDFCLSALVKDRTVFLDYRYRAASDKDRKAGGNMAFRTQERRKREIDNLIRWWGTDVISTGVGKTVENLKVRVP